MKKKDNDGIEKTIALFKTRQGLQEYLYEVMDTRILEFQRLYSTGQWFLYCETERSAKHYEEKLNELLELKRKLEEEEEE